jgi:hypothetical protein
VRRRTNPEPPGGADRRKAAGRTKIILWLSVMIALELAYIIAVLQP